MSFPAKQKNRTKIKFYYHAGKVLTLSHNI